MKKNNFLVLALFSIIVVATTGCSQTKKSLGLERERPDEFTVLDHPPLSMPPGIGLKPPHSKEAGISIQNTQVQAKELLKTSSSQEIQNFNTSPIEKDLLRGAKTEDTHPGIRETVNQEAKVSKPGEKAIKKIIFWEVKPAGDVIDPQEEYKKLHNKDAPGPLN